MASGAQFPGISSKRVPVKGDLQAENDRLRTRVAELEAAVSARDDFLAIAAHELRNPMTPILGQVERLNRMVTHGSFSVAQVSGALGLLKQLIQLFIKRATTLLDVSRMTTGRLQLHAETFELNELVLRVVKAHEAAAEHAGSKIVYAQERVLRVYLDPLAVEQILDNVLLNALRYGGGRPVAIMVGGDDARVWMTVTDQGPGISPADRNRIFERFEQAVSSRTQGGFGIGLWVVGQLVQAMGGEITVESALNQGSSFKVTLPRVLQ